MAMFSDPSFLLFKDLPSSRPLQTLTIAAYSTGAILVTKEGRAFFLSFSPGAYENA